MRWRRHHRGHADCQARLHRHAASLWLWVPDRALLSPDSSNLHTFCSLAESCLPWTHITHAFWFLSSYIWVKITNLHLQHKHTVMLLLASAVLGVVIMSTQTCFVTNPKNLPAVFYTIWKGNSSSFLTPTLVGGRRPLPPEICDQVCIVNYPDVSVVSFVLHCTVSSNRPKLASLTTIIAITY